jgi:hypothetical protein
MFLAGLMDWLMQEKGLCFADTWGDCKMWGEKSGLLKSKNRFRTVCSNYRHSRLPRSHDEALRPRSAFAVSDRFIGAMRAYALNSWVWWVVSRAYVGGVLSPFSRFQVRC